MKKLMISSMMLMSFLFLPVDAMAQWTRMSDLYCTLPRSLLVDSNEIFIGTQNGILKSTNFGIDFDSIGGGIIPATDVFTLIRDQGNVFAGIGYNSIGSHLLRSTDDGVTWNPIGSFPSPILFLRNNSKYLYAIEEVNPNCAWGPGLFRTSDQGEAWDGLVQNCAQGLSISASQVYTYNLWGIESSSDDGLNWRFLPHSELPIPGFAERNRDACGWIAGAGI